MSKRILTIEVHDADKYVQRASAWKRPWVALNAKYFGSPVQISAHALKIDFDTLVQRITESHARHWRV